MKILITLDYELYFGQSGTAEKCMLLPSERLSAISKKYNAPFTYFVDAGYFWRLEKSKIDYPELKNDYDKGVAQLKKLVAEGNQVALHIHPHWEDSFFKPKTGWQMDVSRYKLDDFTESEIDSIFNRYKNCLENIIQQKIDTYRAGGWCLQPFAKVKQAFLKYGIVKDSTCYYGGYNKDKHYYYDFRNIPKKEVYNFNDDLSVETKTGPFQEYPICSETLNPIFFWCLFILGRLFPKKHKGMGDGSPVAVKGFRKKVLSKSSLHCVSIDGYFASRLKKVLKKRFKSNKKFMLVIGHPKASTQFSLKTLEKFVADNHNKHQFVTFNTIGD